MKIKKYSAKHIGKPSAYTVAKGLEYDEINEFINIIVDGLVKSDTKTLLKKIREKDDEGLTKGLQARKLVLENENKKELKQK